MITIQPIVLFGIGMVGLSWALAYAWWAIVRVVNLRQDVLDIRDALFDAAADADGLADPAYQAARDHLNKLAASADCLSLWVVGFVLSRGVANEQDRFLTGNVQLRVAIKNAVEQVSTRVASYLLKETTRA